MLGSLEENLPIDFGCFLLHDAGAQVADSGTRSGRQRQPLCGEAEPAAADVPCPSTRTACPAASPASWCTSPTCCEVPFPFPQTAGAAGLRSHGDRAARSWRTRCSACWYARAPQAEAFSSGECEFLKQLSEHVALASHQARLYGALQQAYDDLRQSQHTVMQQERLRALGQMASGIAHDINNAISPVSLYTESLLEREPNLSERARGYLTTIQRAIEDVARTVARMREFYREREAQLTLERVESIAPCSRWSS